MDIRAKIEELVNKVKEDKDFAAKFQKDPITAVEGVLGIDLPNDQIEALVEAIKAKVNLDKLGNLAGGLGKLFGK